MVIAWWCAVAMGAEPAQNLTEVVGPGVVVDWTDLRIRVTAESLGAGPETLEATEQLARRSAEAGFQQTVGSISVTPEARIAELWADAELGPAIRSRISRWEVDHATYTTGGAVQLHASLSLQELLRPWSLQIARPGAPDRTAGGPTGRAGVPTGIVIDARGTGLRPVYAFRLLSPAGPVLYGASLWEEQAVVSAPYRFLPDGAHPAVLQAGSAPLFLLGKSVQNGDLVLDEPSSRALEELGDDVLGQFTLLVVIDAP